MRKMCVCARLLYGLSYNSSFAQLSTKVLRITNDKQKTFITNIYGDLNLKQGKLKKKTTKYLKNKTNEKKNTNNKTKIMYTM